MLNMNGIVRVGPAIRRIWKPVHANIANHKFSTTSPNFLKEIRKTEVNGVTVIEGVYVPSPRENNVIQFKDYEDGPDSVPVPALGSTPVVDDEFLKSHACPLCKLGMPIAHTDVLILSQFCRADGGTLPRRVTGLCKEQQKRVSWLIQMAHKAGLMPNLKPCNSHFDPKKRRGWYKYNKYYDESIIDDFLNPAKRYVKKA